MHKEQIDMMKSIIENDNDDDEYAVFGEYVSQSLRKVKDPVLKINLKNGITQLIHNTELQEIQKMSYTTLSANEGYTYEGSNTYTNLS